MNIHVVRIPPARTSVRHTCCQGQTSGLMVRPDRARCTVWARPIVIRLGGTGIHVTDLSLGALYSVMSDTAQRSELSDTKGVKVYMYWL